MISLSPRFQNTDVCMHILSYVLHFLSTFSYYSAYIILPTTLNSHCSYFIVYYTSLLKHSFCIHLCGFHFSALNMFI